MDIKQRLRLELKVLVEKWKDKPEPDFMSREYIDRRFDRMKYLRLRRKLNSLTKFIKKNTAINKTDKLYEYAKKLFK